MVFPVQQASPGGQLIGEGIAGIFGMIEKRNTEEELQKTMENPKASPLQKALALQKAYPNQPKLMTEFMKGQRQQAMSDRFRDLAQKYGTPPIAPQEVRRGASPQAQATTLGEQIGMPQAQQAPLDLESMSEEEVDQIEGAIPDEELVRFAQEFPEALQEVKLELDQRDRKRNLAQKERIAGEKRQERIEEKEEKRQEKTQKVVDEIYDEYEGARETDRILGQMEQLNNKGTLTAPATATFLKKMALDLGLTGNSDSELFDKLSNQLTRGIQKFYGSRILATEFQNFLRQIPTLQNSEEGRRKIIQNMRLGLEPMKIRKSIYQEILKENKGKRPLDIREQITDRMDPYLDQLEARFSESLKEFNPVEKSMTLEEIWQ